MTSGILVCALVVLACLCLQANSASMKDDCNLVKGDLSLHYGVCGNIQCNKDGSWVATGCPLLNCGKGQKTQYKEEDKTKPWPECCGGPICID